MNLFFTESQAVADAPATVSQKIVVFGTGTILTAVLSLVCGVACLIVKLPVIAACTACAVALSSVALYMLRRGLWKKASFYSLAALFAGICSAVFLIPHRNVISELFHVNALLTVLIVLGYLCSFWHYQVVMCCVSAVSLFAVCLVTVFKNLLTLGSNGTVPFFVLGFIVLVLVSAVVILVDREKARDRTRLAAAEDKAADSLARLTKLIAESKEFFTLGLRLQTETENAQNSLNELSEFYNYLTHQADDLAAAIEIVKKAGVTVKSQTDKVSGSVQEQSASIAQTSSGMTQIAATLTNISGIADKRRIMMQSLVEAFNEQHVLVSGLIKSVGDVKASSESIAGFVKTVEEIAARTGLLAMNASIEAAHAGSAGKGFAVIAHEIRNLSTQTSQNASQISAALKSNTEVVAHTVETAERFGTQIQQTTNELNSTARAMEEILSGISEINCGTQDIMKSVENTVNCTHVVDAIVTSVVDEVTGQGESISQMAQFADALQQRVSNLEMIVGLIQMVITNIKLEAERTTEMSQGIASVLDTNAVEHDIMEPDIDPVAEAAKCAARDSLLADAVSAARLHDPCMPPPLKELIDAEPVHAPRNNAVPQRSAEHDAVPRSETQLSAGEEYIDIEDMLS